MNRLFFLLFVILSSMPSLEAQVLDPVDWSFKTIDKGQGKYEIVWHAEMEGKWHVYAQDLGEGKFGPIPTTFTFEDSESYKREGAVREGKAIVEYDPNFEMELAFFEHSADWKQTITSSSKKPFRVVGMLEYMTCDDAQCIFPDPVEFDIEVVPTLSKAAVTPIKVADPEPVVEPTAISGEEILVVDKVEPSGILEPVAWSWKAEKVTEDEYYLVFTAEIDAPWHVYSAYLDTTKIGPVPTGMMVNKVAGLETVGDLHQGEPITEFDPNYGYDLEYFEGRPEFVQRVKLTSPDTKNATGVLTFMTCNDELCLPPEDIDFDIAFAGAPQTSRSLSLGLTSSSPSAGDAEEPPVEKDDSLIGLFLLAFFSGFAALLTPCVFPMIPLTVSFFTKQSKTRAKGISNAIFYGICIIVLYVSLGVGVSAVFGADAMNKLATDPWFNIAFFLLLIVFAASFLGAFEITLPNSWVNKADTASNKGGVLGIFFMAFTLALVSFSCTGPIVGTVLVEAAQGGYLGPIVGMFGFSLAIALPFAFFAAFPGWLNSLPQSGGWLNSVKVVLGFLELALAFKFLSNADLVEQWHILERETFIAIWIIIFGMLTMYLLGFIKMSHDSPLPHINVTRLFMAVVTGAFTIYMIPGMWGAPLKLINAFPPPMFYSESPEGVGFTGGGSSGGHTTDHVEGTHKGPAGLYVFHDYDEGLAYAKKAGLPVMLDFTGWACVNCRKMEENVWVDPAINAMLKDEVVLVSLYVDQREMLPESEQKTVDLGNGKTRKLRRVGDKWKTLQELRYNINAQPYYVLMDHNEENIIEASSYQTHGDIPLFKAWLEKGVKKYSQK